MLLTLRVANPCFHTHVVSPGGDPCKRPFTMVPNFCTMERVTLGKILSGTAWKSTHAEHLDGKQDATPFM